MREYKYRGPIERFSVSKKSYVWSNGYSEDVEHGGALYPWNTRAECRSEAKAQGVKCRFTEKERLR